MEDHAASLIWSETDGRGFYPVRLDQQYDQAYWDRYVSMTDTEVGRKLNAARAALVNKHIGMSHIVDIGIGSGGFIAARPGPTSGYDVNIAGIRWLLARGLWFDPYFKNPENAACWDSLEHVRYPDDLVRRVDGFLFVSIPIFTDRAHVLRSKHFRPDEHFHYFTEDGFVMYMRLQGFGCLERNRMEVELGREDIGTFVFRRQAPAI